MSTQNHNTLAQAPETPSGAPTEYIQSLVDLGIPIENTEALAGSLGALLDSHGLDQTYLERNPTAGLLLTAALVSEGGDISSEPSRDARRKVIVDAVLGTYKKTDEAKEAREDKEKIARFTNKELSADLARVFQGDLFSDIRKSTGVEADEITHNIDVWVLNVATEHGSRLPKVLQLSGEDTVLYEEHQRALVENAKRFSAQLGVFEGDDSMPPAWMNVGKHGEKSTIMVPALYAEELIAIAETGNADQESTARNFAEARHELVHCLGSLFLNDSFFGVGMLLEERRAEYFSGDMNGYRDVKTMVDFTLGLHGASVEDIFPKDGSYSPVTAVTRLAQVVGLETMLDLMTAIPEGYEVPFEQSGGFDAEYLRTGNDINDALLRILRREKASHGEAYANAIISKLVDQKVVENRANNIDTMYVADTFSINGPTALAVLAIKDLQRRYADAGDYDWQSAFGDDTWSLEI